MRAYMTIADILAELEIARSTLDTYRFPGPHTGKWPAFPEPVDRIGNSPIFDRGEVMAWKRIRPSGLPGRPRSSA